MPRILDGNEVAEFRARLLAAAEALFARDGVAGVSMRRIAEAMGCSATTPYRYFADKEEILASVRAAAFDRFSATMEAAFARRGSLVERSAAVGRAYWDFAMREPDAYRLMFDLAQPDDDRYPDLLRAGARARACMTAHIRELVAEGRLAGDPDLLGHVIWSATHGIVVLKLAGRLKQGPPAEDILRESMRLLFTGARAGLPPRPSPQPNAEAPGSTP